MKSTIKLLAPLQEKYEQLKAQVSKLDLRLTSRYGDRYGSLKSKVSNAKTKYREAASDARSTGVIPLEERNKAAHLRSAHAGTGAARKEKVVKQQILKLWNRIRSS